MKLTLTLAAALIGAVALPTFAGTTEDITGCATVAVEGSNYTTFADPTCYQAPEGSGMNGEFAGLIIDLLTPDEEEPAAE